MWVEVVLAALNVFQACFIALVAARQSEFRRERQRYNGSVLRALDEVRRGIDDLSTPRQDDQP